MRRWAGPVFVVLLAATFPLFAPRRWADAGFVPDLAVLAVVAVAFRGTPDRAALTGIAVGLLASLWSPEPFTFHAFVLGTAGWLCGQAALVFDRERTVIRMVCAAGAVVFVRVAAHTAAAISCSGGAPWTGAEAGRATAALLAAAACAAAVTPVWFSIVRKLGLLAPMERSFRDV